MFVREPLVDQTPVPASAWRIPASAQAGEFPEPQLGCWPLGSMMEARFALRMAGGPSFQKLMATQVGSRRWSAGRENGLKAAEVPSVGQKGMLARNHLERLDGKAADPGCRGWGRLQMAKQGSRKVHEAVHPQEHRQWDWSNQTPSAAGQVACRTDLDWRMRMALELDRRLLQMGWAVAALRKMRPRRERKALKMGSTFRHWFPTPPGQERGKGERCQPDVWVARAWEFGLLRPPRVG